MLLLAMFACHAPFGRTRFRAASVLLIGFNSTCDGQVRILSGQVFDLSVVRRAIGGANVLCVLRVRRERLIVFFRVLCVVVQKTGSLDAATSNDIYIQILIHTCTDVFVNIRSTMFFFSLFVLQVSVICFRTNMCVFSHCRHSGSIHVSEHHNCSNFSRSVSFCSVKID